MAHQKDLGEVQQYLGSVLLAPIEQQRIALSYVATRWGSHFRLLTGRVIFNVTLPGPTEFSFVSNDVVAETVYLDGAETSPADLLHELLEGRVPSKLAEIRFVPRDGTSFGIAHFPLGLPPQGQVKLNSLRLFGADIGMIDYQALAWSLRSHPTPYDGLGEIYDACGLILPATQAATIDVIAMVVVAIDGGRSHVDDEVATVAVNAMRGIERDEIQIGLRIVNQGQPVERRLLKADEVQWIETETKQEGTTTLSVRKGAVVECIVSYKGAAQHFFWIADPRTSANGRKALIEAFDSKLERLNEALRWTSSRGRAAREFESAICSLLWILGLSPLHFDTGGKTQEAVDIFAVVGPDKLLVIECTVGLLKVENKLANLIARTEKVRQLVSEQGRNSEVQPVIISAMPRQQLVSELGAAGEHGVAVIAAENIQELLGRIDNPIDADLIFREVKGFIPPNPRAPLAIGR